MTDVPVYDLLRQANIKTKNHLVDFSDSSWQDFPDTGISTGVYIIFYQGGPIDHGTHIPGPVAQYSAESEYNAAFTAGMSLAHFRMLIHELLNKDPYIITEESPLLSWIVNLLCLWLRMVRIPNIPDTLQGEFIL